MSGKKSYFIDVENVGSKTIEKFLTQDKTSDVVVVTGLSNSKPMEHSEELSKEKTVVWMLFIRISRKCLRQITSH